MQTLTVALSLLVLAVALEEARGLPRPAHKRVRRQTASREVPDTFRVCGLVGESCGTPTCCPNDCVTYEASSSDSNSVVSQLGFSICAETCTPGGTPCADANTVCETRGQATARCWPTATVEASVCDEDTDTSTEGPNTSSDESSESADSSSAQDGMASSMGGGASSDGSCINNACENLLETRLENLCPTPAPAPAVP